MRCSARRREACETVRDRFLLSKDTKIIISDVDGTITREDVMGHVMYAIHQDYTQSGIVRMYNRLSVEERDGNVM